MDAQLKRQIEEDMFRYFNNGKRPFLYKLRMPSVQFITTFRKVQFYRKNNKKIRFIFNLFLLKRYSKKYLIQIPYKTSIGKGLYIGHLGSVIINPESIIGDNLNIAPGVTIGQTNRGSKKGCPTIGNNVWIGTNAVIVGGISIGDNVLIAPNSYVNNDVPSNSVVIGNPSKIIPSESATDGYVHNVV